MIKINKNEVWKEDKIDGIRNDGPYCSVSINGTWVATDKKFEEMVEIITDYYTSDWFTDTPEPEAILDE